MHERVTPAGPRALGDAQGRLLEADERIANLQTNAGGDVPGPCTIPAIRDVLLTVASSGRTVRRRLAAHDGSGFVSFRVVARPADEDGRIAIETTDWVVETPEQANEREDEKRRLAATRAGAEIALLLDSEQRILECETRSPDAAEAVEAMREGRGQPWTGFVDLADKPGTAALHWRLLDGARCRLAGSERSWEARIFPRGAGEDDAAGFELYLVAQTAVSTLPVATGNAGTLANAETATESASIGRDVSPVLRQPITRIIANAETIRTKLAGPLPDQYSAYAADITAAARHLLSLVDDLADLEIVEAEDFRTSADAIDLAEVAKQAVGILAVRAQEKSIALDLAGESAVPVTAEFRRALQILLNLIGNAIRYSPEGSTVRVETGSGDCLGRVAVIDEGAGIAEEDREAVFRKFERLGRTGDGGSGLGLYISRRLARAMGGDLVVEAAPGGGARFELTLPQEA
ncbi:HAMP domain-containing sensor histidine kinase [Qipengyuania sp. JC766]|uniref:sensor histidine kinase n=1 Tax=Qipengyuania sp. JC766 TaxID=3232139 RepID=UPI0034587C94